MSGFFKFSFNSVKDIFSIGWPAGLLQVLWQLGYMVLYLLLSAIPKQNIEILAGIYERVKNRSSYLFARVRLQYGQCRCCG